LHRVRDALSDAAANGAGVVLVGGEAGIGKTRLVDEFLVEVPAGTSVARGQCVDFHADAPPYGPLAAVLRQLLNALGPVAFVTAAGPAHDALRILLPELADTRDEAGEEDVQSGRGRLFAAIAALLESVAGDAPLVVVIEDLHWCDQATLGVLRFLVKVVGATQLLFVFTFRSDEVPHGHPLRAWLPELDRNRRVTRIDLERLTRSQVRRMVAHAWGEPGTHAEVDAIYARSDGIPFFVEELANGGPDAATSSTFPSTLRGVLLARYDTLSDSSQNLLRAVAAGGQRVRHDLLISVLDAADAAVIDAAAREAIASDVLVADETAYAFRHALMQEAIHDQLLPGERVRFHTRYAEALGRAHSDAVVDAGAISYHWMAAHNLRNAFVASIQAMRQARASYAHSAAARMGERAIELWDRVPDAHSLAGRSRVELLSETAYILRNAGESERALALIDEALAADVGDKQELRATMLRNKASFLANDGRTGSIELLEEALAAIPGDEPSVLRANVLGELAARLMLVARFADAVRFADRAYAEASAVGSDPRRSVAVNIRGVSRVSLGDIDDGLADLARAGELARDTTDSARLRYWVNQSDVLNLLGRFDDAVTTAEEGVAIARERGVERTSGAILVCNMIAPLFALGRADRARELLDNALELDAPIGFSAPLQRLKLRMTLFGGDPAGADDLLRRWRPALDRQRRIDVQSDLNLACVAAEIALELGDPGRAWSEASILLRPNRHPDPAFDLPLAAVAARAVATLGSTDAALPPVVPDGQALTCSVASERLRSIVDASSWWPTAPAYVASFEAELGGRNGSGSDPFLWEKAVAAAEHPTAAAQLWPYAAYRMALASAEAGDRAATERWARAARERASRIGGELLVRRADELLERAGLSARAAPSTAPGRVRMTERESQVLDLLAQGLTNREIADRLFISTKTASVHVSNILRKTGAASRTEAAYLTRQPERA